MLPEHIRLHRKLDLLRGLDRSCEVFGAAAHGHILKPPISPDELSRFETTVGTRLPEDYRSFLLCMGNGGAGPYYGIVPLALWDPDPRPITDGPLDEDAYDRWIERGDPVRPADTCRDFVLDGPFYPFRMDPRCHHFLPSGAHPLDGCVRLADMGCGESAFLVVRGPRAGEVWIDQSQAAWPIRPVARSFLEWFERRLDLAVAAAIAAAVPRALVSGDIEPELVEATAPIVESVWDAWRGLPPAPQSDDALDLATAASGFAHLRLWQRRRDPEIDQRIAPYLIALAFEGMAHALEVVEASPGPSSEVLEVRARLLRRLGRDDDALAAWDAVIRAAPHDPDPPRHKALIQIELGDVGGAEATLRAMALSRRDQEEAADLITQLADAVDGEIAARLRALATSLT